MSEIKLRNMMLLDKMFIYSVVVASQCDLLSLPFGKTKPLYLLLSVRALNARYKECNDYALLKFMRANKHTLSFKNLFTNLDILLERGFIIRAGSTNKKIYITTAGIAALNSLESVLRKSTFRYRKDVAINIPLQGRKKKVAKIK